MKSKERESSEEADKSLNPAVFQLSYQPTLDGLRGVAILAVMAFNGHFLGMRGGFVGVDIFFVLSGFLITSLLLQGCQQSSEMGLKNFYIRRALRLLPALFVLMLFCVAYALIIQPTDKATITLKGVLYTLFYVANWAQVPPYGAIGALSHAWSLSVEEQFYILWPLLLLVLNRIKSKSVVLAILLSLIAVSVAISVWLWQAQVPYLRIYFGSDTRAHELLIGCVAALLVSWGVFQNAIRFRGAFHVATAISVVGIVISLFLLRHNTAFVYNGGFTLISVATAILILDILLFPSLLSRGFEFTPLVWIGRISYGLYLWHFPIIGASQRILEERVPPFVYQFIGVTLTFLVATASYYFLEKPFLKLKRRLSTDNAAGPGLISRSQTAVSL